jgi:hypothetical protein
LKQLCSYACALKWLRNGNEDQKLSLLLGNGFCIAHKLDFGQNNLATKVIEVKGNKDLATLLEDSNNSFEDVLHGLHWAARCESNKKRKDSLAKKENRLRSALYNALLDAHPKPLDEGQDPNCRRFLREYSENLYTTNYDLLLYFNLDLKAQIHKDGFSGEKQKPLRWSARKNFNLAYLHGALHIYRKSGDESEWYKERGTHSKEFFKKVSAKLENGEKYSFDMVLEGSAKQKLEQIEESVYLNTCYEKLLNENGPVFIFGWSCTLQDEHIVEAIQESKIPRIVASVHCPNKVDGKKLKQRLHMLTYAPNRTANRDVRWIDAGAVPVWKADPNEGNKCTGGCFT